jgi:hypothetical protein
MPQEERSVFWEVVVSVILRKKCMSICVLFRTISEIELFYCTVPKFFYKKEILRTVSNTGTYFSSDRVGKVYLV